MKDRMVPAGAIDAFHGLVNLLSEKERILAEGFCKERLIILADKPFLALPMDKTEA